MAAITVQELFAKLGVDVDKSSFSRADNEVKTLTSNTQSAFGGIANQLKTIAGLLVTAFGIHKIRATIGEMREYGDMIDKTSIALGISRKNFQEWTYVAGLGGVKAAELEMSFRTIQRAAEYAAQGQKTYLDVWNKLGITIKNEAGKLKSADMLMMEMADGLGRLETDSERVALAMQLMGRSGSKMLPMFMQGSKGVSELRKEAHKLGGVIDDEMVNTSVKLTDAMWRFDFAMYGVKVNLMRVFGPSLIWINDNLTKFATKMEKYFKTISDKTKDLLPYIEKIVSKTHLLEAAAIVLGTAISLYLIPALTAMLWRALPITLAFAALVLIVDELITKFKGGKTVIGKAIDEAFGKGATQKIVDHVNTGWKILIEEIGRADDKVANFFNNFSERLSNSWKEFHIFNKEWREGVGYIADSKIIDKDNFILTYIRWELKNLNELLDKLADKWNKFVDALTSIKDLPIFKWLEEKWGFKEGFGERMDKIFGALPGISTFREAKKIFDIESEFKKALEELKRRDKEGYAAARGLGARKLRGPSFGRADAEKLKIEEEIPWSTSPESEIPWSIIPKQTYIEPKTTNIRTTTHHTTNHKTVHNRVNVDLSAKDLPAAIDYLKRKIDELSPEEASESSFYSSEAE